MSEPLTSLTGNIVEIKARLLRIADHAVGAADYCSSGQDSAKLLALADEIFDLVALMEDEVGPLPRLPVIPQRPNEALRKAARLAEALAAQEREIDEREQRRAEVQAEMQAARLRLQQTKGAEQ